MKDNKNLEYKIVKSEACGHTIEYKMVKKEHELEKARIDEGLSPREKMKAREARSSKEREPKELNPEQYETAKKIARTKAVTERGEKQRKETLKDALHTQKQNPPKSPSKEDLEYPMAASEEECKCEDKAEKCECEDKEMKKREKFYIQKIQELRKKSQLDTVRGDLPTQMTPRGMMLRGTPEQRGAAGVPNFVANPIADRIDLISPSGRGVLPSGPRPDQASAINRFQENQNIAYNRPATMASFADTMRNITGQPAAATPAAATPAAATPAAAKTFQASNTGDSDFDTSMNEQAKKQGFNVTGETAPAQATPKAPQSFGEAFKAARAAREKQIAAGTYNPKLHDTFKYTDPKSGKEASFHSFTKDDFAQGVGNKYNPELRRQQKAIQSSPATPNTETAPSANPIKPADQGSTKLRPEPLSLEQQQKQFS